MGAINIKHTASGADVTLSSDGTTLLLDGTPIGGGGASGALIISNKTAAYTVVAGDLGTIINCTANTFTVSLTAAATLGAGFNVTIWNTSATYPDAITIDPAGTETIDGRSTLILRRGEGMQVVCDGTNWQTGDKKVMRGYAENIQSSLTTSASGTNAIAIGPGATASGTQSTAIGYANASANGSIAISGWGSFATASSNYSVAVGSNSGGSAAIAGTSAGAMALGGSYASGTDSFAAAVVNNTSSYGATGANSVAISQQAKTTNAYGVAIGAFSLASSSQATALGAAATASAAFSVAVGQTTASATGAVAIGNNGVSSIRGKYVYSYGSFAADGDAQKGEFVLRTETTDATATALRSNTSAATTTNQVILPNNSAYAFSGTIVARQKASEGTASAAWRVEGLIRREGSAGTTVLVNSATTVIDNTPGWTLILSADTTNGGLAVTATGTAATNIRWVATIQTSEVTYA